MVHIQKLYKYLLVFALFAGVFLFRPTSAHAATVEVDSNCTLYDAVASINNSTSEPGCSPVGTYGNDDTIVLPSGTTTLTADLFEFTASVDVTVEGQGVGSTIVDGDGFSMFKGSGAASNYTFRGMSLQNTDTHAILLQNAVNVFIQDVDISGCQGGVNAMALSIDIDRINVHDCINSLGPSNTYTGLYLRMLPVNSSSEPHIRVSDSVIADNVGARVGVIFYGAQNEAMAGSSVVLERTSILRNQGRITTGANIDVQNPSPLALKIDAVTVADNTTEVVESGDPGNQFDPTYLSGFLFSVGELTDQMNLTNVTVVNNTVVNMFDNHPVAAGLFGLLFATERKIQIVNATVVGNNATASQAGPLGKSPALFLISVSVDGFGVPNGLSGGGSAKNNLIAQNTYNGELLSCRNDMDVSSFLGLTDLYDVTPIDEGFNITDDPTCNGYNLIPNIYSTIEHEVADNGGPVPTLALLPGSPAVDGGGQVLGITTDARGVARSGYYSVGAYQGQLLGAVTDENDGELAETGVAAGLIVLLGATTAGVARWTKRRSLSQLR